MATASRSESGEGKLITDKRKGSTLGKATISLAQLQQDILMPHQSSRYSDNQEVRPFLHSLEGLPQPHSGDGCARPYGARCHGRRQEEHVCDQESMECAGARELVRSEESAREHRNQLAFWPLGVCRYRIGTYP